MLCWHGTMVKDLPSKIPIGVASQRAEKCPFLKSIVLILLPPPQVLHYCIFAMFQFSSIQGAQVGCNNLVNASGYYQLPPLCPVPTSWILAVISHLANATLFCLYWFTLFCSTAKFLLFLLLVLMFLYYLFKKL